MMEITYGQHALNMLDERAIDRLWVERTLSTPDTREPDPDHPGRTRAFRAIPERDGRVLRVVYTQSGLTYHIVTVFLDRGRGRTR